MKKVLSILLILTLLGQSQAWGKREKEIEVLFETSAGDFRVALYNETPLHRDNFIKLVDEGFYDSLLIHRTILGFMVQMGDPNSRHAKSGELLGGGKPAYTIPAEIRFPTLFHRRGALSMAREPDDINPEMASSGSQFFIVTGRPYMPQDLKPIEARVHAVTEGAYRYTDKVRQVYQDYGGAPHLDGQYTVFGHVVDGMKIINQIQMVPTDENDRPEEDIRIIRATIIK
ncbi:MAG: peptidylprolyl isomerase [Bacteroidaceae bacterium]|nr:peptidylprolyl isomerase [Bacteroidaceae bacterium]